MNLPTWQIALILISISSIIVIGRWLYLRSVRIKNRIQMNKLFTNITHELLTPLSILSASVEHLSMVRPEEQQEYELMDLNIQRIVRLLQQILETSKAQEGGLKLMVSKGDVMQYITETARSIKPLMNRKQLDFTIHCHPESMIGWIDTDKLDKIIFNLLSNAAKYTPEQGKVVLDVTTNNHYNHIIIKVSDTGIGIPKEMMKKLFKRFSNGDYSHFQVMSTGLGLALTHDLVYLHKGSIQYKSKEGQGTTFIIDLPIGKEAFSASQIDEKNQIQFNVPNNNILDLPKSLSAQDITSKIVGPANEDASWVLIVEDNRELMMLMQQLLSTKYHTLTAFNGQQALDVIRTHRPDIIVSDVMMPEMDGYELTRHIKQDEELSHMPIILLTAKTQEEDVQEALKAGADDYMPKPFKLKDLELRIDNIIANRERIRRPTDEEQMTVRALTPDEEFLQRAAKCIENHMDDSYYDREAFAADMGTSSSTLYNKLRALTGMTITTFIRSQRIKAACRMAKENPDLRVSDIAYRVGFKDPKYFATSFKKEMGVQPKEYFSQMRGEKKTS